MLKEVSSTRSHMREQHAAPRPAIVMLAPSLTAVSGVSTHTNLLFNSAVAEDFRFVHFQAGSEGRKESKTQKLIRLLASPFQLAATIVRHRAPIVHINTAMDPKAYWRDIWYVAVARLLRCKVVLQIHGGRLPEEFFGHSKLLSALLHRVLVACHAVVMISEIERRAYREFAPAARIEMIPNAIPVEGLLDADSNKAQHAGPLNIGYLGRLVASKGVPEIIEAVRLLRDWAIPVRLSIAGSGPIEASLREAAAKAQLSDRIVFRGALFGADKNAFWSEIDLFVFPTYHKEGLPYSLLESMAAAAIPVISPMGGIPDVMQDGVHGLFVPPRDPTALADLIARLDRDRTSIVQMATAARQRICEHYTIARLGREFRCLYLDLQGGG